MLFDPPVPTLEEAQAIAAWNYLSNGSGGLDWNGMPVVIEHLGIKDVEGLLHRLVTIKTHRPRSEESEKKD